jgi:1-hydroxycarotenoid 3,4-desaturase
LPQSPTVYVCAQARGVGSVSPELETGVVSEKKEPLFCLINAPATGDTQAWTPKELAACETATFSLLQRCGLSLQMAPELTIQTTPRQFHQRFPATGGALYGQATHGWMQVFPGPRRARRFRVFFWQGAVCTRGRACPWRRCRGAWRQRPRWRTSV